MNTLPETRTRCEHVSRARGAKRMCRLDAVIVINGTTPVCGVHARFVIGEGWRDEVRMLAEERDRRALLASIQAMVPVIEGVE